MKIRKKILVALSGGVDSAVAAALLKKQGFDVFGVYFRFFDGKDAKKSLNKAKKVAEILEIPLEIIDARKDFKKKITDYFIASYKKGITPNPCVVCNKEMKFRLLFELMKKYKTNFIATGHYARVAPRNDSYKLLEAKDKSKDQSYFLYKLNQRELAKTIFPLGNYKKIEVKKIAKKIKLPVFEAESHDICFLSNNDLNTYLGKYLKCGFGNIVGDSGEILGKHKGLSFYTIGQRKGIEIGGNGPYFVIGKKVRKNQLLVSNDPKKLLTKKFDVGRVNWINGGMKFPLRAQIQIRYHAEKVSAIIESSKFGKYTIETKKSLRAVTPGQSAVFYKNKEVIGGGIIT